MHFHRFTAALLAVLFWTGFTATAAHAACDGKLGTARDLAISPYKHSAIQGYEKSLGLRHKEVILTFDDGPLAYTPKVLKALKNECVRATFFVVGRHAGRASSRLKAMQRAGHTIAHHSWNHERLPNLSPKAMETAVDRGVRAVNKALYGVNSTRARIPFFRYPYLAKSKRSQALLKRKGLVEIGANIDTLDWKRQSPGKLHDFIMRELRSKGRGIVLMHDIQPRTAKMLPRLLRSMKRDGFKVVHMVPSGKVPKVPAAPVVVAGLDSEQKPVQKPQVVIAKLKGSVAAIETLPEVVKVSVKRQPKAVRVAKVEAPKAKATRAKVTAAVKAKKRRLTKRAVKRKLRKSKRVVRKVKRKAKRKVRRKRSKRRIAHRNLGARFIIQ